LLTANWRRPLVEWGLRARNPITARELALLRRLDRAPADEIGRVQEERLETLLRHALDNTDYYCEVLGDCGVVRAGRVDLGRLECVPILAKGVIREQERGYAPATLPRGRRPYERSGTTCRPN
jgi:phenylacetate-coenzyme A ligase PaaK-like adenylate-forming protein